MSCTNPNCECKPGTFANLNPPSHAGKLPQPHAFYVRGGFTVDMLDGLEWQEKRSLRTASGKYHVEITWALDRYRVSVWRRVQEPKRLTVWKLVRVHHPLYAGTAVKTANKLLRWYERNGF